MPDVPNRKEKEEAMAALMLFLFNEQQRIGGDMFAWQRLAVPAMAMPLAALYLSAHQRMAPMSLEAGVAARMYAERRAIELATRMQQKAAERAANGKPVWDDIEQRAESIGVTETTAASTAGEMGAARGLGLGLDVARWHTERDSKVCPRCSPLDGHTLATVPIEYSSGPPIHPQCRCWLEWERARQSIVESQGDNCGTGAGGFQPGNTCAKGGNGQTKSAAFKEWFGDSKVVDEQGKPLVVYHGTTKEFTAFDSGTTADKTGNPNTPLGFFFSDSASEAGRYASDWGKSGGNIKPVFLSISNPYHMPYSEFDGLAMAAYKSLATDPEHNPEAVVKFGDLEGQRAAADRVAKHEAIARDAARTRRNELIAAGYDGIVVKVGGAREWIAFHPHQIKSATGNRGTFSKKSADITESQGDNCGTGAGGFQVGNTCAKGGGEKRVRFAVGAKLSKAEREEVLKSLSDVYRENGLKQDRIVSYNHDGDPIYGYPIRPDLFIKSDITGKPLRHYVTLADGTRAHPSELFGISQAAVNRAISRAEIEAYNAQRAAEITNRDKTARISAGGDKQEANRLYHKTRRGLEGSYFMQNAEGHIVRVDANDPADLKHYTERGFKQISQPAPKA